MTTPISHTAKRRFVGTVIQDRSEKTINVLVKTTKIHPKYNKQFETSRKYLVHDEQNTAKIGDQVEFEECRPLSKSKRWRLVQVMSV